MSCLLKKKKIRKIFLILKDFFKQGAACIVQFLMYNKLVMHIKMNWMKNM